MFDLVCICGVWHFYDFMVLICKTNPDVLDNREFVNKYKDYLQNIKGKVVKKSLDQIEDIQTEIVDKTNKLVGITKTIKFENK